MSGDIDPNAVAAAVTADLIKSLMETVKDSVSTAFARKYEKLFPQFDQHLKEVHDQIMMVKVLCCPDVPTEFKSIYVCPTLSRQKTKLNDNEFVELTHLGENLIVRSQGGSGKTFLMRHVWLKLFEEPRGRVPIFIELRGLNGPTETDLLTYVRATAVKTGGMSPDNFLEFCKAGKFVFLFDGFDEIERDCRDSLEKQILTLSHQYKDCSIVVTGRPDDRFSSWSNFTSYNCEPFDYDQFEELIDKVPFNSQSKKKFQKVATKDFFASHRDFLSNPLLAQMMLMTYRDNAEIPRKLSIFYENCYLTLFLRHDALKEQFRRPKLLDQDEFRRIFSIFCFYSYIKDKPDFTTNEIRAFIEKAIERCGYKVSVDHVLEEFLETVNLIQREGTKYKFIHRSFQEYFAAHCAVRVLSEKTTKILTFFAERQMDKTLELAFDMHPDLVIAKYFIPKYEELQKNGFFKKDNKPVNKNDFLNRTQFSHTHRFSKKGNGLGASLSWVLGESEYICFCQSVERVFGIGETDHLVAKVMLDIHSIVRPHSKKYDESKISSGAILSIHVVSKKTKIDASYQLNRDYKKIPPVVKILTDVVIDAAQEKLPHVASLMIARDKTIKVKMSSLITQNAEQSSDLATDFGV